MQAGFVKSTYNPITHNFMAPKDVQLTIGERLAALKLFDEFKGGLSQMAAIFDDCKACGITDEQFTAAGMKRTPSPDGQQVMMNWNEEGSEAAVSLTQEGVDYLLGKIKAKSDANEFTLADKAVMTLEAKLK